FASLHLLKNKLRNVFTGATLSHCAENDGDEEGFIVHGRLGKMRLFFFLKLERQRVHAVTQAGRPWTIVEYVSEMRATAPAPHFGPHHSETAIGFFDYVCR